MNNVVKRYDLTLKNLSDNLEKIILPIFSISTMLMVFYMFSIFAVLLFYISYVSSIILENNGLVKHVKDEADILENKFKNYLEESKNLEQQIQYNESRIKELTKEQSELNSQLSPLVNNALATSSISTEIPKIFNLRAPKTEQEQSLDL